MLKKIEIYNLFGLYDVKLNLDNPNNIKIYLWWTLLSRHKLNIFKVGQNQLTAHRS